MDGGDGGRKGPATAYLQSQNSIPVTTSLISQAAVHDPPLSQGTFSPNTSQTSHLYL